MNKINNMNKINDSEILRTKHSIFSPNIYPIGRLEYFFNILKYSIPCLFCCILSMVVCIDNPPKYSLGIFLVLAIISVPLLIYLETINRTKRIYDIGFANSKENALTISVIIFVISIAIPLIGGLIYIIAGIILLFIPSNKFKK